MTGGPGVDRVIGNSGDDYMSGGDGNDTMLGLAGNDSLSGEAGADSLAGGEGNDSLRGDWTYSAEGRFNDDLDGGPGTDNLHLFRYGPGRVTVDLAEGTAVGDGVDALAGIENAYVESDGNDILSGSAADNIFSSGAAADTERGLGGDDTSLARPGDDTFDGGAGVDTISFEETSTPATVTLVSGVARGLGFDQLTSVENVVGSHGDDIITGNASNNVLRGRGGQDILRGRAGNDVLRGGTNASYELVDHLSGGAGDDVIDGADPVDRNVRTGIIPDTRDEVDFSEANAGVTADLAAGTATGGDGTDTLLRIEDAVGSPYDDTLRGTVQGNELNGSVGNDILDGRAGDDEFESSRGDDTFIGGDGVDGVAYNYAGSPVTVNLATGTATGTGAGNDTLTGIENIGGTMHPDILIGDDGPNIMRSISGNDTINGNGGDDQLEGGRGVDTIDGGDGTDKPLGGPGNDTIDGGPGDDWYTDEAGADSITGGLGSDTVDYYAMGNALRVPMDTDLAAGYVTLVETDTVATVENVIATRFGDDIAGNDDANLLKAYDGFDSVSGRGGNDTLMGMGLSDTLDGGDGVDLVSFADWIRPIVVDLRGGFSEGPSAGTDTLIGHRERDRVAVR